MHPVNELLVRAFKLAPRGTAAEVARQLAVKPTAVSKWANGEVRPKPEFWQRLEGLLGLSAGEIAEADRRHRLAEVTQQIARQRPLGNSGSDDAVQVAIELLDAELQHLRGEVSALRSEVDQLRRELPAPARSSESVPPATHPSGRPHP